MAGGGHSLIWPIQVCAAEQGVAFKVLNRVYNFTIKRLEQGVSLDWKPLKECKDLRQDKTKQCFICSLIQSYVHRLYPNNLKS